MSDDVQKIIDQNKNKKIDEISSSNSEENILKHYNDNHYPVGAPGGRGGQFAPATYTGGGSSASSKDNFNKNNFKKSKKEDPIDAEYSKKEESKKEESKSDSKNNNNNNNNDNNNNNKKEEKKDDKSPAQKKVESISKNGQSIVNYTKDLFRDRRRGSKKINHKDYSKIPTAEMQQRIQRMKLEEEYAELRGDNKYVMTGREKTRETIQNIGAIAGIALAIAQIVVAFRNK